MDALDLREPAQARMLETWYHRMRECNDLDLAFHKGVQGWLMFRNQWKTKKLRYMVAGGAFIATTWLTEWCDGAFFGQWVDREHRQSRKVATAILNEFTNARRIYPVVLAATTQLRLTDMYIRVGMGYVGTIPAMWNGHEVYLYAIAGIAP